MKDEKILIVGYGSIGKRHLKNILALGYKNVAIVSRSTKKDTEYPSVNLYTTIDEAFKNNFYNTVFICTPTSSHVQNLLQLISLHVQNIYVEKPVSDSYKNIEEIKMHLSINKTNVVVGYDLHFDKGVQKVKELISKNIIGKIVSANAFVGQHLSQWRPNEDYKNGMSAKKASGGGVLLDLIHEFDYLIWFVGNIETVACSYTNTNELQIETEDVTDVLLKFSNGASGTIHLDYLQKKIIRNCIFTGTKGTIILDLVKCNVCWIDENNVEEELDYSGTERNERFISTIKSFLENKNQAMLAHFDEGLKSLRAVLASKKSCEENRFVKVEEIN